jgi:hypothetical protein
MKIFLIISILIFKTTAEQNMTSKSIVFCSRDLDCIHGICDQSKNLSLCQCERGWTFSFNDPNICNYQQKSKLAAFILSFCLGGFGADWYYLSVGNSGYIIGGVFKMLTLGGLGIWWIIDWIRILTNSFVDGQGISLIE